MEALFDQLVQLFVTLWSLLVVIGTLVVPWIPLAAWIVFWMFCVNWEKLWPVLARGGLVGVLLIGVVMVFVWGTIAPPAQGYHSLLGLTLSNFVGKTVYVTALLCIMLLCGALQLAGCCADYCRFKEQPPETDSHSAAH